MKNASILFVSFLIIQAFFTPGLHAQAPETQWQKSFGGLHEDILRSAYPTTDGGYILAGWSYSNDGDVSGHHGSTNFSDFWVLKLNTTGDIIWQKSLGGTNDDVAKDVQTTLDGGYIIAGASASSDGDVSAHHIGIDSFDYWVVKLNAAGNILWQKSLGGSGYDSSNSINPDADGGYTVMGVSDSNDGDITTGNQGAHDIWLVKLSGVGDIQWQKSLGGSNYDYGSSQRQTADGGYILSIASFSNDGDFPVNLGFADYWVVKLSASGAIEWKKSLGGSGQDYVNFVQGTADGGYVLAGHSRSNDGDVSGNHGYFDGWVVKLGPTVPVNEATGISPLLLSGPNPAAGRQTIRMKDGNLINGYTLIDIAGRILNIEESGSLVQSMEIDFSTLPSGIYLLQVRSGAQVFSLKVIVS